MCFGAQPACIPRLLDNVNTGMVHRDRGHKPNDLPTHSNDDPVRSSRHHRSPSMPWASSFNLLGGPARQLRVIVPDTRRFDRSCGRRSRRTRSKFLVGLFIVCVGLLFFGLAKHIQALRERTLIFGRGNLQTIWKWEIASGHHPSRVKGTSYHHQEIHRR